MSKKDNKGKLNNNSLTDWLKTKVSDHCTLDGELIDGQVNGQIVSKEHLDSSFDYDQATKGKHNFRDQMVVQDVIKNVPQNTMQGNYPPLVGSAIGPETRYRDTTISIDGGHDNARVSAIIYDTKSGNLTIAYENGASVIHTPNNSARDILQSTIHTIRLMDFITPEQEEALIRLSSSKEEAQVNIARNMLAGMMKEFIKNSIEHE